jgi:hypothetical protein
MSDKKDNSRECQLLALLYRVEELLIELRDGGKDSPDYKDLTRIIKNLENYLVDQRDGLI